MFAQFLLQMRVSKKCHRMSNLSKNKHEQQMRGKFPIISVPIATGESWHSSCIMLDYPRPTWPAWEGTSRAVPRCRSRILGT